MTSLSNLSKIRLYGPLSRLNNHHLIIMLPNDLITLILPNVTIIWQYPITATSIWLRGSDIGDWNDQTVWSIGRNGPN
jgi:hypothetical protein